MTGDEYHVEQDRRVNSLITEVATLREQQRNTKESFDELKRGQSDLLKEVAKGNAASDRMEATLSYSIESKIDAKLVPIKEELALRKEEAIIRKTQIAMWSMMGAGLGSSIVFIGGLLFKLIGH